jgi:peptidoglycan-associated lipoprotein
MKKLSSLKIAFLVLIIANLSSCQNLLKKNPPNDFKIQDDSNSSTEIEPYETVNSEQEAQALNQQSQSKLQEIEVQDRVFFNYDSFELNDESKKVLDAQITWLKSDNKIKIIIEGHCDERGTREYNLALGERRANSVKKYLSENGITPNRVSLISYGKEKPAFFGASDEIFAKNRRAVTASQ